MSGDDTKTLASAKAHDTRYASFVARMLAAEAAEVADIARINARLSLHKSATADTSAATVAPRRVA